MEASEADKELRDAYVSHIKKSLDHKIKEVDAALGRLSENGANATATSVRLTCISLAVGRRGPHDATEEIIQEADALAAFILTGKKPGDG